MNRTEFFPSLWYCLFSDTKTYGLQKSSKPTTAPLGGRRPFSIMPVKLAFNATRNSRIKPKNAKIMLVMALGNISLAQGIGKQLGYFGQSSVQMF